MDSVETSAASSSLWSRLLTQVDEKASGERNMQLDSEYFAKYLSGEIGPMMRIYGWLEPTVSIGRFQDWQPGVRHDLNTRVSLVPIVRRPTGGLAVLHTPAEVTYLIVGGERDGFPRTLRGVYDTIAEMLIEVLSSLGVAARTGSAVCSRGNPLCFARGTAADLVTEDGDKIGGSAQRREKDHTGQWAFMQHGSLVLRRDHELELSLFGAEAAGTERPRGLSDIHDAISESKLIEILARSRTTSI